MNSIRFSAQQPAQPHRFSLGKSLLVAAGLAGTALVGSQATFKNDEDTVSFVSSRAGTRVVTQEGWAAKIPFLETVNANFSPAEFTTLIESTSEEGKTIKFPTLIAFTLPSDPEALLALHKRFVSANTPTGDSQLNYAIIRSIIDPMLQASGKDLLKGVSSDNLVDVHKTLFSQVVDGDQKLQKAMANEGITLNRVGIGPARIMHFDAGKLFYTEVKGDDEMREISPLSQKSDQP